jgi:hypothetical protein
LGKISHKTDEFLPNSYKLPIEANGEGPMGQQSEHSSQLRAEKEAKDATKEGRQIVAPLAR